MLPPLHLGTWLLASLPLAALVVSMLGLKHSGSKAGLGGWLIACATAAAAFGADGSLLVVASLKGIWATLFILGIIWGATALFNVVDQVGGFQTIGRFFARHTGGNKLIQLFVIGGAFPSFLQGVVGFGAPVAVTAPLLVGVGFSPLVATAGALLGHAWTTTFGSLGSAYRLLVNLAGLEPVGLALWTAVLLGIACVLTGFCLAHLYGGWKSVRESVPASLIMWSVMAVALVAVAVRAPYIAAVVAGMSGLFVGTFLLGRTPWYRSAQPSSQEPGAGQPPERGTEPGRITLHAAFTPYYLLIGLVGLVYLTPLQDALSSIQVAPAFPETRTSYGWVNQAVPRYAPLSLLTTPASLIFATVFLSVAYYRLTGRWQSSYAQQAVRRSIRQAIPASTTLVTLGMMAMVMTDSGMITLLAQGIAQAGGEAFPVLSPFVGALGAFMTGSNASSNILFGALQRDVAQLLGVSPVLLGAAQTAGGAIGCLISPMKIPMGTALTGISGQEGRVLAKTVGYTLFLSLVLGAVTWLLARVLPA